MQNQKELAKSLLNEIEDCEEEERYRALRDQIYGLGPDVIAQLRMELESVHFRRRMAAATNLGRLGDHRSLGKLIELLSDPHAGVREMALFALGILGDSAATEPILASLSDYDADVRYRAVVALGDLGYPHLEDVLIRAMSDDSYGVREHALSQLRLMSTPRSAPVILKALLEREPDMQQMAEEALDRVVPMMTREHYKRVQDQLTARERRLILNYLESRNLQEVYATLWQRLQIVNRQAATQRGLDKYGRLLNASDEFEMLHRAYERDEVVDLLVEHFTDEEAKRSILLLGEAGSGKTAVIHEFARRLLEEDSSWQILETNTSELISGTRYLGDWETKLKEMAEAILKEDKVIIYLTNPNDLLGAGAHSKSDENFADFFKPYLHRGQLRIIAECTEEALKSGLTRDPGFLRLFRQVQLREMTDEETKTVVAQKVEDLRLRENTFRAEGDFVDQIVDFARSFYTRSVAPGRASDLLDAVVDWVSRKEEPEDDEYVLRSTVIPPCLSEVTGISLDLLDDTIALDLAKTRQWFTERLIDQEEAVDAIVDRLALVKAGLHSPDKPLGIYFLVGPTGVGKTYFAKLVAERLFGDSERMLRFDLSEYQGRFAVEKLIGSPHDKDREGLLTEAVRNQPYSVLLFDEFEKADSEIFPLFLQVFDEGRLTDARGNTTDFRQAFIFLTSNLGASRTSVNPLGFSGGAEQRAYESHIRRKLDEFFAPEFLNRLDQTIVFEPLTHRAMERLVELEVKKALTRRGLYRRDVEVSIERSARLWLAEHGFSARFGARELKRVIERNVLTQVARLMVGEPGVLGQWDPETRTTRVVEVYEEDGSLHARFATEAPPVPRKPRSPARHDPSLDGG